MTIRFTVAKKITLGVVLILFIGIVSMILIYQGLNSVKTAMDELAKIKEPASAASYEMEIQLHGTATAVLRYLDTGDPTARSDATTRAAKFQKFHEQYVRLSGTAPARESSETLHRRHRELKALGEALMAKKDKQEALNVVIADNFEKIDEIIDDHLQPLTGGSSEGPNRGFGGTKAEAVLDMEADIAEMGVWLANYQRVRKAEYKERMFKEEKQVRTELSRLKAFDLTKEERHWTAVLEKLFNQTTSLIGQMLADDEELRKRAQKFVGLVTEMDRILDDQIQVFAKEDLLTPTKAADEATLAVIDRVRFLIPLFLLSAIVAALVLLRMMTKPVKALIKGTEAIAGGDLTHRIQPTSRDEFADLANDFNRMVEQLEATTVSKQLLQTSEAELQRTVTELRREVNERERAEAEQFRLQASLRRSETMSAIGALTAGVAHEVRNPLFGISSTLDAFEARFGGDGQYQRYLHVLRGEVDRLVSLMGALLDYGKPPVQETAPVKIDEVIGGALRATEPLAKSRGVNLDEQCLAPGMTIRADAQRLCQVFQNLLENAIHHSSVDDSVIVRYEACDLDDRLWAQCRIIDSGPGFRAEDLPHVFEPFFTRRKGGTGLGLSIVQRIVDEHGGIITAANGSGGGAVMTIKLPVVDDGTSMHNAEGTPFGDP